MRLSNDSFRNFQAMNVTKFAEYVLRRFRKDQCLSVASALTLTSLLSIVPLMAVILSVFSAFPEFDRLGTQISDFVFKNFVPSFGEAIHHYLMEFVAQARSLQLFGIAFLIATALKLMSTIDKALNSIWETMKKRSWIRLFLLYWSFLTLCPIFIGLSVGITAHVASLPIFSGAAKYMEPLISTALPFVLTWMALTLLYIAVPNRKIPFLHGLAGGALGTLFFELGKRLFTFYITLFPNFKIIFGAMTSIPLFFLWIYISWVVVLLGAEIVRGFSAFPRSHESSGKRDDDFSMALVILGLFYERYRLGKPLTMDILLATLPGTPESQARRIFIHFLKTGIIGRLSDGRFTLLVSLHELTLGKFHRMMPWRLPDGSEKNVSPDLSVVFQRVAQETDSRLAVPLNDFFTQK